MKLVWIVVFAVACDGGSSGPIDAGADAIGDATMDVPDAEVPDADTTDTDGDGVYDSIDVCPTIVDPAQVDLDGDGAGWMCDPVESKIFSITGIPNYFKLAARGNTAGASFQYTCPTGSCSTALSVGPGGASRADSPADAWLSRVSWGWISGENRVLWSFIAGGLGEHNATTGAFTMKYDGFLDGGDEFGTKRFERDQLTILPSYSPTEAFALLEPRGNGDVFIIAESARDYGVETIAGQNPATLLYTVPMLTFDSLQRFTPGAAASQTVLANGVALSHAREVTRIMSSHGELLGLCADQDSVRYFIRTDVNAAGQVLPVVACNLFAERTTDRRLTLFVSEADGAHPTGSMVAMIDHVMHPIAISPQGAELFGYSVPAAIRNVATDPEGHPLQILHAIDATGAIHRIAGDATEVGNVTDSIVSVEGNTIHVLATRGGNRVLFRYRNGTVSEVTMPAYTATNDETTLLTTREGAALISTFSTTFVVPSQSMTVTELDFRGLRGFMRGNATLFFASHTASTSKPALYSYAEIASVPQYAALTPESTDVLYAYPLDNFDGVLTDWFAYVTDGACLLAYPEVTGSTVALVGNVPCLGGAVVDGVTPDAKLVVRTADNVAVEELLLLDGHVATRVATSSTQIRLMYAAPDSHEVLGWIGTDTTNFVCLATHPERCWTPPLGTHTWAAPVPGNPDWIHVVYLRQVGGGVEFTSIRSLGTGTRPQPL